jgi:uncharacterized repeat protein (TIGR02543 family)
MTTFNIAIANVKLDEAIADKRDAIVAKIDGDTSGTNLSAYTAGNQATIEGRISTALTTTSLPTGTVSEINARIAEVNAIGVSTVAGAATDGIRTTAATAYYTVVYNDIGKDSGTAPAVITGYASIDADGVGSGTGNKYFTGTEITFLGNTGSLEKDGYVFKGWTVSPALTPVGQQQATTEITLTMISQNYKFKIAVDTSFTPIWEANYSDGTSWAAASFDLAGATSDPANYAVRHIYISDHTFGYTDKFGGTSEGWVANPVKTGWTFDGWENQDGFEILYSVANGSVEAKDAVLSATADISLKATWVPDYAVTSYWKTITFDLDGADAPVGDLPTLHMDIANNEFGPDETWPGLGEIAFDNPTKEHYDYDGWSADGGVTKYMQITDNNSARFVALTTSEDLVFKVQWRASDAVAPTINAAGQPVGFTAAASAAATPLSVTATIPGGFGTLSYEWYYNLTDSTAVAGATPVGDNSATFTPADKTVGTKYYFVVVTNTTDATANNPSAKVTSSTAAVTWTVAEVPPVDAASPVIGTQPQGYTKTTDQSASALSVVATIPGGVGILSYQWYYNLTDSSAVAGATSVGDNSTTFTPTDKTIGTKYYFVVVTNTTDPAASIPTASVTSSVAAVQWTEAVLTDPEGPDKEPAVPNVTAIRVPVKSINLQAKKSFTLPFIIEVDKKVGTAPLTWSSSNKKVATVTNGKIKAVKNGKAKIVAKAANGKSVTISVSVSKKQVVLKKISVTKVKASMKVKKTVNLGLKIYPKKATLTKISYKASGAIKVDKAGKVTAVKKGKGKLTITVNNKKIVKKITVK